MRLAPPRWRDGVHLGVSVDEPGHEVMRETGRFLWFFPPELEVVE